MRKVLSLWKVILIVIASAVGVSGATALGLYLSGSLKEKVVEPADMSFSHNVVGEGYYDAEDGTFKLSSDCKLTIVSSTKDVTEDEVTLSFGNKSAVNGYVSDGFIKVPEKVKMNVPFDVILEPDYYEELHETWIKGSELDGFSVLTAKSENIQLTIQTAKIVVDVPSVYETGFGLSIEDDDVVGGEQTAVVGAEFSINEIFKPEGSKYMFMRSTELKDTFYSVVSGRSVSFDNSTKKFVANEVGTTTIKGYTFSKSYYQYKFYQENQDLTEYSQFISVLDTLAENKDPRVLSATINIKVEAVDVDSVDVAQNGQSYSVYVDKEYTLTANSTKGDKNLGVSILDKNGNSLSSLYGKVGIKIPQGVEGFTISGGRIAKVTEDRIVFEDYNPSTDYSSAPEGTSYYLLPNTRPAETGDYFWKISASNTLSNVQLLINFFYEKENQINMFFESGSEKSISVSFAFSSNQSAAWKDSQNALRIQIGYGEDGKAIPSSVDLAQYLDAINSSNIYKTIKYFLYADTTEDVDLTEVFSCLPAVEYSRNYKDEKITIEGVSTRDSYKLYELESSILTALKSYTGAVKVIAAIVRTDVNRIPYTTEGKYQIISAGRGKEVVVEGTLSITMMTASYRVDTEDELIVLGEDGQYYIPSTRMNGLAEKTMIYLDFTLRSDDIESDADKVVLAYNSGKLKVVCLDATRSESDFQYITLQSLSEKTEDRTENTATFVGEFSINKDAVEGNGKKFEGIYVGLQLQFTDQRGDFYSETIYETEDDLQQKDHFYIYYQNPTTMNAAYVEEGFLNENSIQVDISASDGISISWGEQDIGDIEGLAELLSYGMKDQKTNDIDPEDGVYRIYFAEINQQGDVVSANGILSFNNDSTKILNFNSTSSQDYETTRLKVSIKDKDNQDVAVLPDILTFRVKSEGLSYVKGDVSTDVNENELERLDGTSEIVVEKLVNKNDTITLSNLFEVYTGEDEKVDESSYEVKLDNTYLSGLSDGESENLVKMLIFNGEASEIGDKMSKYANTEITSIGMTAAFGERTKIVFNITEKEHGIYKITLNLWLFSNISCENRFNTYYESYRDYLQTSEDNTNAISVFAGETYVLDTYLKFDKVNGEEKYKWSTAEVTLTEAQGTGIVSLSGANLVIKEEVYQATIVTFTLHYQEISTYAFSKTCTLYVVPNIAIVKEARPFIDISAINASTKVSNFYKIVKLTDFVSLNRTTEINGFSYENITTNKYISVDANGVITATTRPETLEYEIGNLYTQELALTKNDGTKIYVDAVVMENDKSNPIVSKKGKTQFGFSIGYFSDNAVEMIQKIVEGAKVVLYDGKYTLLLVQGTTYQLCRTPQFLIVGVNEMSYIQYGDGISRNRILLSDVDKYFADGQYVIVEAVVSGNLTIRIRLDAIATKLGDDFVEYGEEISEDYLDYANLLGEYATLQDKDIYQELLAGQEYTIVNDGANILYDLIPLDGAIDFTKTYYIQKEDESYEVAEFFYYDGDNDVYVAITSENYQSEEVVNADTYYVYDEDNDTYVDVYDTSVGMIYQTRHGFYIDSTIFNQAGDNIIKLEVVEGAEGYISGLATTDGQTKLTLKDLVKGQEVYVVLKLKVSDLQEKVSFSWYYRIKVIGNFDKGEVVYPYATNTEYLETTSKYYHVAPAGEGIEDATGAYLDKYYEISFDEVFGKDSLAEGYKRFNYEGPALARTEVKELRANGVLVSAREITYDNQTYYAYGNYLVIGIDEDGMVIYLKNVNAVYSITLERKYYNGENIMFGSAIQYNIKINDSPKYVYEVTRKDGEDTTGEKLIARDGKFTTNVVAGREQVTLETKLAIKSNGTESLVREYNAYVLGETEYVEDFAYNPTTHKITFTPKGTITQNGSFEIGFYEAAYNGEGFNKKDISLIAFRIIVNVESFYQYNVLKVDEPIVSGTEYKFKDIFRVEDSRFVENTSAEHDWTKTYYVLEGENYNVVVFYYKDSGNNFVETTQAVEGVETYYYGEDHEVVTNEVMLNFYINNVDKTNNTTLTLVNGNTTYKEEGDIKYNDLFVVYEKNGDKYIRFAFIETDIVANVKIQIDDFSFEFNLGVESANVYNLPASMIKTDSTARYYSDVEYTLTSDYLDSLGLFVNHGDDDEYLFVNGNTRLTQVRFTPEEFETSGNNEVKTFDTQYTIAYQFNEKEISTFNFTYRYNVRQNVFLYVNYPDPDKTGTTETEYYKDNLGLSDNEEICFAEKAIFADENRIKVEDNELAVDDNNGDEITKNWKVVVSSVNNARIIVKDGTSRDISNVGDYYTSGVAKVVLSLVNTSMDGSVTFKVSVNKVERDYTFIITKEDVFETNINATNYSTIGNTGVQAETIYAEDLSTYGAENQNLFEEGRILKYKLSSNATTNTNYYVRMEKDSMFNVVVINDKEVGINKTMDIGLSLVGYTYEGVYGSAEAAQTKTSALLDVFETAPTETTSRVVFTYRNGKSVVGATTKAVVGGVEFTALKQEHFETETPVVASLTLVVGENEYESSKTYALYLTYEFTIAGNCDSVKSDPAIQELYAGTEVSLFEEGVAFGMVNKRTQTAYSRQMMEASQGNIELHIYGFADYRIGGDEVLEEYHRRYTINPRAGATIDTDEAGYNYITLSETGSGKATDFSILANGAKNDGNYIMMQIKYSVTFGDNQVVGVPHNILFKVLPNSAVYYSGTRYGATEETIPYVDEDNILHIRKFAGETYDDEDNSITIEANTMETIINVTDNQGTDGNAVKLYAKDRMNVSSDDNALVAYMYGNTGVSGNNANTFSFDLPDANYQETINGNVFNDYLTGISRMAEESSYVGIVLPNLAIGEKYYYVDLINNYKYRIRVYIKLTGNENPTLSINGGSTLSEGETLGFGASYSVIAPQTIDVNGRDLQVITRAYNEHGTIKTMEIDKTKSSSFSHDGAVSINVTGAYVRNDADTGYNVYNGDIFFSVSPSTTLTSSSTGWLTLSQAPKTVYAGSTGVEFTLAHKSDTTAIPFKFLMETGTAGMVVEDIVWTEGDNSYSLAPIYTPVSFEQPEIKGEEAGTTRLAVISGISANGYKKRWVSLSEQSVLKSRITEFTISKVEFYYGETKVAETGGTGMFTSSEVYYCKTDNTLAQGQDYNKDNHSITIPRLDGFLYGTGTRVSGIKMVITLTDGTNVGTIEREVTFEKNTIGVTNIFQSTDLRDGGVVELTENDQITQVNNDTLEVDLEPGASITFSLQRVEGDSVVGLDGNKVVISNTKNYKVTEYVGITRNLKGLTTNLTANSSYLCLNVEQPNSNVKFRYNGAEVAQSGEVSARKFQYKTYSANAIKLKIFDSNELPAVITATSCAKRRLYFVYKYKYDVGVERLYQCTQEFSVYPAYYATEPVSAEHMDTQGNIRIPVQTYYKYTADGRRPYYVIPYTMWAQRIKLISISGEDLLSTISTHMLKFEINDDISGGAGAAFIDENGNIYTHETFDIASGTITINIDVKISTADGTFETTTSNRIGQVRMYLVQTTLSNSQTISAESGEIRQAGNTIYFLENGTYYKDSSEAMIGSVVSTSDTFDENNYKEINEEFELSDIFEEYVKDHFANATNIHYHVIKDNSNVYHIDNLDTWKFTSLGKHDLTIYATAVTLNGATATNNGFRFTATFYCYNSAEGSELTYVIEEGEEVEFDGLTINAGEDNEIDSKTFNESGYFEYEVVKYDNSQNTTSYKKYMIYVYKADRELYYKKQATEIFALRRLDKENEEQISNFYKVGSVGADSPTQTFERTTQEEDVFSETDNENEVFYLADITKESQHYYILYRVTYYIYGSSKGFAYDTIQKQTTSEESLKKTILSLYDENFDVANIGNYNVYRIDENNKLTIVENTEKITADMIEEDFFIRKTNVETNKNAIVRYTIYVYESVKTLDMEVQQNNQYQLSSLDEDILGEGGGRVEYFVLNRQLGILENRTETNLSDLSSPVVQEYYIKVTTTEGDVQVVKAYKLQVTFTKAVI